MEVESDIFLFNFHITDGVDLTFDKLRLFANRWRVLPLLSFCDVRTPVVK